MIDLTFTVDEVNAIMGMLGRQPYEQVEGLINKIRAQAIPQLPKPEVAE
jgi:hypothetical protein